MYFLQFAHLLHYFITYYVIYNALATQMYTVL